MCSVASRLLATCALLLTCHAAGAGNPDGNESTWSPTATRRYLDDRIQWWLDWAPAARGQGTACVSCHTTLTYALALPSLLRQRGGQAPPAAAARMLDAVRTRVDKWAQLIATDAAGKDALAPISHGERRESALDTEAVLNALILVANDPPEATGLGDSARRAIDIMWDRQRADGSWRWLEFGLRPWESEGEYFGAALAAVAVGSAANKHPRPEGPAIATKTAALKSYLKTQLASKPLLHNKALALWAASRLGGVLGEEEKRSMVANLFGAQRADGGWSLQDLGKEGTGRGGRGWEIVGSYPRGAVSDGYATGLVVFALKRAGVSGADQRIAKGMTWLATHQANDGTWPVVYVNKERDPQGNVGKFNRDAGAAFALLALWEPGR